MEFEEGLEGETAAWAYGLRSGTVRGGPVARRSVAGGGSTKACQRERAGGAGALEFKV